MENEKNKEFATSEKQSKKSGKQNKKNKKFNNKNDNKNQNRTQKKQRNQKGFKSKKQGGGKMPKEQIHCELEGVIRMIDPKYNLVANFDLAYHE